MANQQTQTIRITGNFDAASASAARRQFVDALHASHPVVLDLTDTAVIDAAAIQLVVSAARTFRKEGLSWNLRDSPSGVWAKACRDIGLPDAEGVL